MKGEKKNNVSIRRNLEKANNKKKKKKKKRRK